MKNKLWYCTVCCDFMPAEISGGDILCKKCNGIIACFKDKTGKKQKKYLWAWSANDKDSWDIDPEFMTEEKAKKSYEYAKNNHRNIRCQKVKVDETGIYVEDE